jgi:superfamily II DNA or RNA helicase
MIKLRPYQQQLRNDLKKSWASGHKSSLVVLPTGGGKTYTFSSMAYDAALKGKRVLATAHRDSLINQISGSFGDFGIEHGIIKSGRKQNLDLPIQVASVDTLAVRLASGKLDLDFDFVIMDEAHHAAASRWAFLFDYFKGSYFAGFTATPCRKDGKGLEPMFSNIVEGPTIKELIGMGHLVAPRVYVPKDQLDFSSIKTTAGDFNIKAASQFMDRPKIIGDALDQYNKHCPGESAVCFCTNINHAESVAQAFRDAGYRAAAVYGKLGTKENTRRLAQLSSGELQVVTSCDLISEGTDVPRIAAVFQLRPTWSLSLYLQQVGRGLRPAEGKSECLVFDHAGNYRRHGLPQQDREWTLKGKKKKKKIEEAAISETMCESCFAVFEPQPVCPYCGAAVKPKVKPRLMQEEGELVEITEEMKKSKARNRRLEESRCETLQDWIKLAKSRGYEHPVYWAKRRYNFRQKKKGGKVKPRVVKKSTEKIDPKPIIVNHKTEYEIKFEKAKAEYLSNLNSLDARRNLIAVMMSMGYNSAKRSKILKEITKKDIKEDPNNQITLF